MKKILITTSSFDLRHVAQADELAKAGFEIMLNPYKRRLTEDEAKSLLAADVVGMIAGVEPLTEAVLSAARDLKVIARCGVGLDSVDLAAAAKRGIRVSNTPDAPTLPVAELTLAHMLNLLRSVSAADAKIRKGNWKQLMGGLLNNRSVGIVGFGRIGRKVCQLVSAFGARVLAYDVQAIPLESGARQVTLAALLQESDIVTLHVPYGDDTHHLIGDEELQQMKKGALLLNISRGGLVDEAALHRVLLAGHLGGAGLDAFEVEPYSGPLCALENVLLTAHMGSYAKEARAIQECEAAQNLIVDLRAVGAL